MLKVNDNLYIHSGNGVSGWYAERIPGMEITLLGGPGFIGRDTPYVEYRSSEGLSKSLLSFFREFLDEYGIESTTERRKAQALALERL